MASTNSGKGAAFEKRARMDAIQKQVLGAVCLASFIVGTTLTVAVFMTKQIKFNIRFIKNKEVAVQAVENTQANLKKIENSISKLAEDKNFESVAMKREVWCDKYTGVTDIHSKDDEYVARVRMCSSLRVISDAMPSAPNEEAMMSSLNRLVNEAYHGEGAKFESMRSDDNPKKPSYSFTEAKSPNLHVFGSMIELRDEPSKVHAAMDDIESSIRNYDIVSAEINFIDGEDGNKDEIKLRASFSSYYSSGSELDKMERYVCYEPESDECKAMGGDTILNEEKAGQKLGDGSVKVGDKSKKKKNNSSKKGK